jgi:DNA polymerase III sliding clamp (beta) subunit (PCNA family)
LVAIQAKILLDTLKEFPEQPLTFNIDLDSMVIDILSANGKFSITGQMGEDFPVLPTLGENKHVWLFLTRCCSQALTRLFLPLPMMNFAR